MVVLFLCLPIAEPRSVSTVFDDFFNSFSVITGLTGGSSAGSCTEALGGVCYESASCPTGYYALTSLDQSCYDVNVGISFPQEIVVTGGVIKTITGAVYGGWSCCIKYCGDGVVQSTRGEQCDGSNLNGETCISEGYSGGTLGCTNTCVFSYSSCVSTPGCDNDGICDSGESCSGCSDCYDQSGAQADCLTNYYCDYGSCMEDDGSLVSDCGNNFIDAGEVCDGTNLNGNTCFSVAGMLFGSLSCKSDCSGYNTVNCYNQRCGDGLVTGGEHCDGTNLNTASCSSLGLGAGILACSLDCSSYDVSDCYIPGCGNGRVEGTEQCDDGNDNNNDACTNSCRNAICGDSVVRLDLESCDTNNLNGQTCVSQGFDAGTLRCTRACAFDISLCTNVEPQTCGNGVREGTEICDGSDLNGRTCLSEGYGVGSLLCSDSCNNVITTSCDSSCNDCGKSLCSECADVCSATDNHPALETSDCNAANGGFFCMADGTCADSRDTSACGNNIADFDLGEQCDGNNFGGLDCRSFGIYTPGYLMCDDSCSLIFDKCFYEEEIPEEGFGEELPPTLDSGSCGGVGGVCMNSCITGFMYFNDLSLDSECQQQFGINSLVCCVPGEEASSLQGGTNTGLDVSEELKEALREKREKGTTEEPLTFDVDEILMSPKTIGGLWIIFLLSAIVIVVSAYLHKRLVKVDDQKVYKEEQNNQIN